MGKVGKAPCMNLGPRRQGIQGIQGILGALVKTSSAANSRLTYPYGVNTSSSVLDLQTTSLRSLSFQRQPPNSSIFKIGCGTTIKQPINTAQCAFLPARRDRKRSIYHHLQYACLQLWLSVFHPVRLSINIHIRPGNFINRSATVNQSVSLFINELIHQSIND